MLDVSGKWVLVTGASRGIGRQIALAMAKLGANLVLQSRNLQHTHDLAQNIKVMGNQVLEVEADLANPVDIAKMVDQIKGQVTIDILFNNAGYQFPSQTNLWHVDSNEYLESYKINVIAPMLLIEAFLPEMLEQGFGRIINTTSGIKNQPEQGAYAASKGALDKISRDYANKLIGNITINLMDPGWIQTDLGGPNASHEVETVIPGMIVCALADQSINGQWLRAQDFAGVTLDQALVVLMDKAVQ